MNNSSLITPDKSALGEVVNDDAIVELATNGLNSENSRVMYAFSIRAFLDWRRKHDNPALSPALIESYKKFLLLEGRKEVLRRRGIEPEEDLPAYSSESVNLQLCAVRRLVRVAAENGIVDDSLADRIGHVKGVRSSGHRVGNWLTREEAQTMLHLPNTATLRGLRDRALLAVLLGAGLRRSEAVALTCRHIQKREGRWMIVDIRGKGRRVRSIPIPIWVKTALDGWLVTAGIRSGPVFRKVYKSEKISPRPFSNDSVYKIVRQYGSEFGEGIATHDLRRTFAKLARQGGSPIDQIQLTLGHASVATTERYLGTEQNITDAPSDRLGLDLI